MAKKQPAKRRIDWEAIERDFRTGKFSQAELATKHRLDPATLNRKIKRDQAIDQARWQKDLAQEIRQATNAALTAAIVKSSIKEGQEKAAGDQAKVNEAVKTAAELNTQVILRHRSDIVAARQVAMDMLGELAAATHSAEQLEALFDVLKGDMNDAELETARRRFAEFMRLSNRVGSIHKLADTLAKVQTLERKAFSLDDDGEGDQTPFAESLANFIGQIHSSGGSKLPIRLPGAKA